jgi:hypothetical protein
MPAKLQNLGTKPCIYCHKKTDTYGIKLVHMLRKAG